MVRVFEGLRRRIVFRLIAACASVALASCSSSTRSVQRGDNHRSAVPSPIAHAGRASSGAYKIGKPYLVGDRWYTPAEEPGYDRMGVASWYGADFHGKRTANGERFDMNALTAAHPTMPLPSYAYVTNLANGRTVLVRVNDRGPFIAGRIIDLSYAAASVIGTQTRGLGQVRVRYAGLAPLDGDTRVERGFLAGQPWFTRSHMGLGIGAD